MKTKREDPKHGMPRPAATDSRHQLFDLAEEGDEYAPGDLYLEHPEARHPAQEVRHP